MREQEEGGAQGDEAPPYALIREQERLTQAMVNEGRHRDLVVHSDEAARLVRLTAGDPLHRRLGRLRRWLASRNCCPKQPEGGQQCQDGSEPGQPR